jgi:hypothetical protein
MVLAAAGVALALTMLVTSSPTARADTCYTQGYDFSGGDHDYYAYAHECLGGAAVWYLYYGQYYQPAYQPYYNYGYNQYWYNQNWYDQTWYNQPWYNQNMYYTPWYYW